MAGPGAVTIKMTPAISFVLAGGFCRTSRLFAAQAIRPVSTPKVMAVATTQWLIAEFQMGYREGEFQTHASR